MPAKKRLVPPIRPNADGTGFVRAGRPAAPARNRSGGPRRAASTTSSSSAASSAASATATTSQTVEAAASTASSVQTRGRGGRSPRGETARETAERGTPALEKATSRAAEGAEKDKLQPKRPPATTLRVATAAAPPAAAPLCGSVKTVTSPPTASPKPKPTSAAAATSASTAAAAAAPSRGTPAASSSSVKGAQPSQPAVSHSFELGIEATLGPSECLVPRRTLHQLGLLSGSLVQLSTSYGDVYAEARPMRSAAATPERRIFVSEDAAAVLVDKAVQLSALAVPRDGVPLLSSVSVRSVPPEDGHGGSASTGVPPGAVASLASTLEWQAMFRRVLHHKIAYVHLRTTQRLLTHRLALEVVAVTSTSPSCSSTWGLVTDATVVCVEGDAAVDAASSAPATTADSSAVEARCTLVVGESGTGKTRWLRRAGTQEHLHEEPRSSDSATVSRRDESVAPPLPVGPRCVEWIRVEELPQGEGSEVGTATVLRESFQRARQSAPATVLLDDLHLICAKEATSAGSRWAMSLIAHTLAEELLDLQRGRHDVWVVASAPSLESLDTCLTSSSLLGQHVVALEMPAGPSERLACLRACLTDVGGAAALQQVSDACLREVAGRAHGFTQRDVHRLAETAVVKAFQARQSVQPHDADLRAAAAVVHPSSLKRFEVSVPNVSWDDIGGSAEAKQTLCDVVEWCLGKQSWIFTEFNLTPPKGVLLYGPPGCSKTMLAKALANESHMNFISVKGPEVFSKWVGDSEKAVRDIFERARAASPCVVFIDELDGMCGHRGRGGVSDRVISQFLTELDGLPAAFEERKNALVFVAATNRPDSIDGAVLRPGRIDRRVYVGLPSCAERVAIAEIQFKHIPISPELTAAYVAERTEGYTGAEVVAVVKEAAFHAITADARAPHVAVADVDAALVKVRPRIQAKDVEWYKQWPHNTPVRVD